MALLERREQLQQIEIAKKIFALPVAQWDGKVALLPVDQHATVRRCLELLRQHAQRTTAVT